MGNIVINMYNYTYNFMKQNIIGDLEEIEDNKLIEMKLEPIEQMDRLDEYQLKKIFDGYFPDKKSIEEFKKSIEYETSLIHKDISYYTNNYIDNEIDNEIDNLDNV